MPVVPAALREQYRALVRAAHRGARPAVHRQPDRLRAVQHRGAARPRAVPLPVGARAPEPGPMMSFLAPALLAGLLAIAIPIVVHLVQRERRTRGGVSVADVPAPDPEPVRAAPRHPSLAAAGRCASAAFVLIAVAFARPFLAAGGAPTAAAAARARSSSCSTVGQHGLRRPLGPRAGGGAARRPRTGARRPRRRRVLRGRRRSRRPRPTPAPAALLAAIDRAKPGPGLTRYGPALRAAAGLLDASAAHASRDRARLRLPEVRVGPGAGRAAAAGRHAHAGARSPRPSTANAALVGADVRPAAGGEGRAA